MNFTLPEYSNDSSWVDLILVVRDYHQGQSDPVYAFTSREGRNISSDEVDAVHDVLEEITNQDDPNENDSIVALSWIETINDFLKQHAEDYDREQNPKTKYHNMIGGRSRQSRRRIHEKRRRDRDAIKEKTIELCFSRSEIDLMYDALDFYSISCRQDEEGLMSEKLRDRLEEHVTKE